MAHVKRRSGRDSDVGGGPVLPPFYHSLDRLKLSFAQGRPWAFF